MTHEHTPETGCTDAEQAAWHAGIAAGRDIERQNAAVEQAAASAEPSDMAHEIWAAAQLAPGEGIVDGAARVEALLSRYGQAPAASAEPARLKLSDLQRRWLKDTIRDAYDSGYSHARDNRAVPGDGAPGYQGRELEQKLGERCAYLIERDADAQVPAASIKRDAEFDQFLTDVMTAAGLVTHGRRCKDLGERLGARCMKYQLQAPAANGDARDAARYRWLRKRWSRLDESYANGGPEITSLRVLTNQEVKDGYGWDVDPLSLDRAIDAAITQEQGK